jgi:[ribosomal protein S5]-alanine N-acetyltransferase
MPAADEESMTGLPLLETPRLVLRIPTPEDAAALAAYVRLNREHLAPWEPARRDSYYSVDDCRARLAHGLDEALAGRGLPFALIERDAGSEAIVGRVIFNCIERSPFHAARLGYSLDHRFEGRGLMTEALQASIRHCFDALNLHRIMANHVPENRRSARLLERLGFVAEGYAREYLEIGGQWRDHVLTALTNERWQPAP